MESLTLKELLSIEKLKDIALELSKLGCNSEWLSVNITIPTREIMGRFNEEIWYKYYDRKNDEQPPITIPDEITLNIRNINFKFILKEGTDKG